MMIMLCYEALVLIFSKTAFVMNNLNYLNIFFWLTISVIIYRLEKGIYHRNVYNETVFKISLISFLLYYIIYYVLGFAVGFMQSPLNFNFKTIVFNLIVVGLVRLMEEYIRYYVIKANNSKLTDILIYIIMLLAYLNCNALISNFGNGLSLFKYLASSVIPIMAFGLLANYIAKVGDFRALSIIALPISIVPLIIPIAPNLNWFLYSIYNIVYCVVVYLIINYYLYCQTTDSSTTIKKKKNPLYLLPYITLFTIVVLFVLGVFTYVPIAVLSNSMYPTYERGDVLIYRKVSDPNTLKVGDVLCYSNDKIIVMHRIVAIEDTEEGKLFTTKGDNVTNNDPIKVTTKKVIGVMTKVIKKVGYPTVWLYELLNS